MKTKINRILNIFLWTVSIILLILVVNVSVMKVSGKTPNIFGYRLYTILTSSMEPELQVGDVILSKTYTYGDELEVGDIVTYLGKSGEVSDKLITHRIVAIDDRNDYALIVTKGDANTTADTSITSNDIESVEIANIKPLAWIYKILSHPVGFIVLFVIPLLSLIIEEIISLIRLLRSK